MDVRSCSRVVYWGMVLALWAIIAAVGSLIFVASTLPPIQLLEVPKRPPTVEIVGLDGPALVSRGEMSGTDVPIRGLPPYLPKAFVAIEDRRFYSHFGVDPVGLLRATFANLLRRHVSQGGSTITQQLAKNLFLTQERTLWRKMQEVVLALWLERKLSKTEILELYLNRVYFGAGAYGVEAAAQRYFGKPAAQLKIARSRGARGPRQVAFAACAESQSGRRRTPRAGRVDGHGANSASSPKSAAKTALAHPARAVKSSRRRLGQLRRRLDHGRARRSRRPCRQGSRG